MFGYYLRLAMISLKRNRILTALMVAAIALGIGMSMTSMTVLHMMGANPLSYKDDQVRRVQLDNWDKNRPWDEDNPSEPPDLMTYQDVVNLVQAHKAEHEAGFFPNVLALEPDKREIKPYMVEALFTTSGFFPIFEPPFRYGGGWSDAEDRGSARVAVINDETNDKLFGGENSVGRKLRLGGEDYTIVGVLDKWHPTPRAYHISGGAFGDPHQVFVPFTIGIEKQLVSTSNNSCFEDSEPGYQGLLASECIWVDLWVQVKDEADAQRYLSFLNNYVQEQKKAGRFPRPVNNRVRSVSEWLESQRVVGRDVRTQVWLAFAFFAVCLINTVGLLLAKFMGKAPEIGLRRAVGASKPAVFAQYLTESGLVGIAGGVLGLVLTGVGLLALRKLYAGTSIEKLAQLDWNMVGLSLLIALVASLVAGLYPTWRACQVQPATQLKTQ
ncbi:ABC transporter permease [Lysobacter panacisoli]|uniref:ABC transporter permease n=1 Tax=Lysobacter panacisoli TaxID=1255263 RepID=A0ABP9LT04_9GAMM|nr:ABC transporter permease [Lysobacter panacisoli]